MKLHEHLAHRKIPMAAWGRACGVPDRSSARRYAMGERMAPPEVVVRTYLWSAGAVTPNDWYDLPPLPGEAADSQEAA